VLARLALALVLASSVSAMAKPLPPKKKGAAKVTRTKQRQRSPDPHIAAPVDAPTTPAYRYAQMSSDDCLAELATRKIDVKREIAKGIQTAVRLAGPLHGVTFKTDLGDKQRESTPWEIGDCALVLAMDDFAQILVAHDIVEVRHYSMYRVAPKNWPDDKIGIQHIGGTALDAARFTKSDGKVLDVLKDFHGGIGTKTCGDGAAPHPATPEALELREILCAAVDQHLFNVVLTPNFNKPHRNHFHLEVMRGVKWFLVH
jgi:hypothetical protein